VCERGDQGDRKVDLRVVGYTSGRSTTTTIELCQIDMFVRRSGDKGYGALLTTSRVVVYQVSYEDRAVVRVRDGTKRKMELYREGIRYGR
jgi:hypothetical protein